MRTNSFYCRLRLLLGQYQGHRDHEQFSDRDIVFVLLWAEHHRRPVYWACNRRVYPPASRFVPPSASTMSRRGCSESVLALIEQVRQDLSKQVDLSDQVPASALKLIDSRPLLVGNASGDTDARSGRAVNRMGRGYRLCVLASGGVVRAWTLGSLNVNDQVLAAELMPKLEEPWAGGWGYVVADNGFDSNRLCAQAAQYNHLWLAPPRQANRGVRDRKRNTPQRLRALDHSDSPLQRLNIPTFGQKLMHCRKQIEALFGHSTLLGLGPLPPWVRTMRRVRRHVACQLLLLTLRQLELRQMRAAG